MTAAEYLSERLDGQIAWYEMKSARNKQLFFTLQILALVAASTIPLLAFFADAHWARFGVAALGALSAAATALGALYQCRELWIDYRATAEVLMHERFLYLAGVGPYADGRTLDVLAERVESLLIRERAAWQERLLEREDRPAPSSSRSCRLQRLQPAAGADAGLPARRAGDRYLPLGRRAHHHAFGENRRTLGYTDSYRLGIGLERALNLGTRTRRFLRVSRSGAVGRKA